MNRNIEFKNLQMWFAGISFALVSAYLLTAVSVFAFRVISNSMALYY
jgi:signal peptidase I